MHTNEGARDYKILRCKVDEIDNLEIFIPPKKETVIGDLDFLDDYIIRGEKSDAIPKLFVRNIQTNKEEEIKISEEVIGVPSFSFKQRDTNTTKIKLFEQVWQHQKKFMNTILLLKRENWLKKLKYHLVMTQINISLRELKQSHEMEE